jgi:hypothetical protein
MWDVQREFDDIVLNVRWAGVRALQSSGDFVPSNVDEYALFEIAIGTGESLVQLGPRWHAGRAGDAVYWSDVLRFTQDVLDELKKETPLVLEVLASRK